MSVLIAIFDANPLPQNLIAAWSFPPVPFAGIAAACALYASGWRSAHRTRARELPRWRAACFFAGLAALWLAVASPIDALDDYLLTAHMIQHFMLMSVAPPLLILGAPVVPMLRGLPPSTVRAIVRPLLRARWFHALTRTVTHPVTAWLAMNAAFLGWHIPAAFELTFRSELIHDFEHVCFFATAIGFWWVVFAPWPALARWPRWTVIPYLLAADVLNTILSATLAFSGRVLYPSYAQAERITRLTPLQDQIAAGAEMWVLNSLVMLAPAIFITVKLLGPRALRNESSSEEPRIANRTL